MDAVSSVGSCVVDAPASFDRVSIPSSRFSVGDVLPEVGVDVGVFSPSRMTSTVTEGRPILKPILILPLGTPRRIEGGQGREPDGQREGFPRTSSYLSEVLQASRHMHDTRLTKAYQRVFARAASVECYYVLRVFRGLAALELCTGLPIRPTSRIAQCITGPPGLPLHSFSLSVSAIYYGVRRPPTHENVSECKRRSV